MAFERLSVNHVAAGLQNLAFRGTDTSRAPSVYSYSSSFAFARNAARKLSQRQWRLTSQC